MMTTNFRATIKTNDMTTTRPMESFYSDYLRHFFQSFLRCVDAVDACDRRLYDSYVNARDEDFKAGIKTEIGIQFEYLVKCYDDYLEKMRGCFNTRGCDINVVVYVPVVSMKLKNVKHLSFHAVVMRINTDANYYLVYRGVFEKSLVLIDSAMRLGCDSDEWYNMVMMYLVNVSSTELGDDSKVYL